MSNEPDATGLGKMYPQSEYSHQPPAAYQSDLTVEGEEPMGPAQQELVPDMTEEELEEITAWMETIRELQRKMVEF